MLNNVIKIEKTKHNLADLILEPLSTVKNYKNKRNKGRKYKYVKHKWKRLIMKTLFKHKKLKGQK